jgi:exodeoxyribonuclease III
LPAKCPIFTGLLRANYAKLFLYDPLTSDIQDEPKLDSSTEPDPADKRKRDMPKKPLKLISWNVNGIRAIMKKDFLKIFKQLDADIFALQETKIQEDQRTDDMIHIDGYQSYWSYAETRKGYSGTTVYSKREPEEVNTKMGIPDFDNEGRLVELVFKDFAFFNIYFPNGQKNEERLNYKLDFYGHLFDYLEKHRKKKKPIIITGDYNTAHNEIDLKRPKQNEKTSGFMRIERDWLDRICEMGYVDTFRHLYPETEKYSWWSYRANARENNTGWRLDYFFITPDVLKKGWLQDAFIDNDTFGSDHCPVGIMLQIN